jgi:predicted nucleic acid-binding protein
MRVYLDAMIWIYALEGRSAFSPAAQGFLRKLRAARHTIVVSHFLLAETLVVPVVSTTPSASPPTNRPFSVRTLSRSERGRYTLDLPGLSLSISAKLFRYSLITW